MNGRWFPEDYWQVPGWQNVLESPAAVQLHHRLLAATSLAAVTLTAVRFAGAPLPRVPRNLLLGVAALTTAQVRTTPPPPPPVPSSPLLRGPSHLFLSLAVLTSTDVKDPPSPFSSWCSLSHMQNAALNAVQVTGCVPPALVRTKPSLPMTAKNIMKFVEDWP